MTPQNDCSRLLDEVTNPRSRSPEMLAHIAVCPDCRGLRESITGLRAQAGSLYKEGCPASLKAAIMARVASAPAPAPEPPAGPAQLARFLLPITLVAGVTIGGLFLALTRPTAPPPAPAASTPATTAPTGPRPASAAAVLARPASGTTGTTVSVPTPEGLPGN